MGMDDTERNVLQCSKARHCRSNRLDHRHAGDSTNLVCTVSALPAVAIWFWLVDITSTNWVLRSIVFSGAIVPSYVLFALCLTIVSPVATRLVRWRTPPNATRESPIWGGRSYDGFVTRRRY